MRIENILQALNTQFIQRKGNKSKSEVVNNSEDKVEI